MRPRLVVVVALLTLGATCARAGDDDAAPTTTTTTAVAATTTTTSTTTTAPAATLVAEGRLAVLDGFQIFVMDADGTGVQQVTGADVAVQPVWSPDGRQLAWSYFDGSGTGIATMGGLRVPLDGQPFYTSWSPDGNRIAYMHSSAEGGIEFGLIDVASGAVDHVHGGQPYYMAWAPDSAGLMRHVGETLELTGLAPDGDDLGTPAPFQAPSWSGDVQAYALASPEDSRLVVSRGGDLLEVARFRGFVVFLLSPDGSKLAYQIFPEQTIVGQSPLPQLSVVELATGEEVELVSRSFGFFWDRAGDRLLYLTLAGDALLQWHVWDGEETRHLDVFSPTPVFAGQYLPFFDQYAQSHRLWSPGGEAFVFSGTIAGVRGIWVRHLDEEEAVWVANGDVAFWQ